MSSPVYLNFYNVNVFSGFTSRYSSPLRPCSCINWWSLTIFYIKILELSSSFDTGLCKIPVDLYSPVRILETTAFISTFSMIMFGQESSAVEFAVYKNRPC